MFLQGQKGVPAPDADVVKGGFDDRTIVEDRADLPRDRLALFQRRPRRQLIFDLAVITVGRRLELLRDDEQQADAGGEGGPADADAPGPMIEKPRQIGRASCRVRVCQYVSMSVVAVSLKTKEVTLQ